MTQARRAAVLDTSAIVEAKRAIATERQWEFFERLKELVLDGQIYFPKAVREELRQARHHDTPETWALNVYANMDLTYEPGDDAVAEVMSAQEMSWRRMRKANRPIRVRVGAGP